jgi:hypothetical protein
MQPHRLLYNSEELVIKDKDYISLVVGVLCILMLLYFLFGPYEKTRIIFKENLIAAIVLVIFLVVGIIYSFFKAFDRSIKIVINKEGIWLQKIGLIPWNNIYYYYFENQSHEVSVSLLKIKLIEPEKEVQVDVSAMNKSFNDIERAIQRNAKNYNIKSLGIDQK